MDYDLSALAEYDANYRAAFSEVIQVLDEQVSLSCGHPANTIAVNAQFRDAMTELQRALVASCDGDEEAYAEWENPLYLRLCEVIDRHCVDCGAEPISPGFFVAGDTFGHALMNLEMAIASACETMERQ